jgi:hypothetical protein
VAEGTVRRPCRFRSSQSSVRREPLAEAAAITPHLVLELDQIGRVGIGVWLLAVLDRCSPLPLSVAVESFAEMSRAFAIHGGRLKGAAAKLPLD